MLAYKKYVHHFLAILVILIPLLFTFGSLAFYFKVDIDDYSPVVDDTALYFHQIGTFKEASFKGGYYTESEGMPRLSAIHFGYWGPGFVAVYGSLAKITGWYPQTVLYYNLFFLVISLSIYILLVKTDLFQLGLLAFILLTSWMLFLYIPTVYQESFHHAIAITSSGFVYYFLTQEGQSKTSHKVFFFFLLLLATFVRFTWALLFIPFFILIVKHKSPMRLMMALGLGLSLFIVGGLFFQLSKAPYYTTTIGSAGVLQQEGLKADPQVVIRETVSQIGSNLALLSPISAQWYLYYAAFTLVIIFFCYIILVMLKIIQPTWFSIADAYFHCFNLTSMLFLTFSFYDPRNTRIIFPALLLSILIILARKRHGFVVIFILYNALFASQFFKDYRFFAEAFFPTEQNTEAIVFGETIAPYVSYQPNDNAWCNTLLMPEYMPGIFTEIPFGIGYSVLRLPYATGQSIIDLPLKSRFIVKDGAAYRDYQQGVNLIPLTYTPYGYLFYNLDTPCKIVYPRLDTMGLSSQNVTAYQNYNSNLAIPSTAMVINPMPITSQYLNPLFIGSWIETNDYPEETRNHFFDLIALLPQIDFRELATLEETFLMKPAPDYILLSEAFWSTGSLSEIALLENPQRFRLVQEWNMGLFYSYYLYAIIN